jgi:gliding motility-associated lipoprotein GldH
MIFVNAIRCCLLSLLLLFYSCDDNRLYEENRDLPDAKWNNKNKLSFDFTVPDTVNPYNFYFNIRNTDEYPYSNIYVFFRTTFPNGKTAVDTVEFPLMNDQGRWIGKGQGDVHDCQLIFKKAVRFPITGNYHIEAEQAMREETLLGVISAGIRLDRYQEK